MFYYIVHAIICSILIFNIDHHKEMQMNLFDILASLLTLITLEIVLGIDNVLFLSILTVKLPVIQRNFVRRVGLFCAWMMRLLLLLCVVWLTKFTQVIFVDYPISIRSCLFFCGGVFLLIKAIQEIYCDMFKKITKSISATSKQTSSRHIIMQIVLMDLIFSLDSVLTAIGLTDQFWIMAIAMTCAILVMLYASNVVSRFIVKYPRIKMLAFNFLILVGLVLVAESLQIKMQRSYIYFAMIFALFIEILNILKQIWNE